MDEITFLVQGSSTYPYKVTFVKDEQKLRAFCTCPAGENGQYCKHRFAILTGISSGVVGDNKAQVATIRSWVAGTDLDRALGEFTAAEMEYEKSKRRLSLAKKRVTQAMRR